VGYRDLDYEKLFRGIPIHRKSRITLIDIPRVVTGEYGCCDDDVEEQPEKTNKTDCPYQFDGRRS
jgi:hypothetical protein